MTVDRTTRRSFLDRIARVTGAIVLAPISEACTSSRATSTATPGDPLAIPRERLIDWDAVSFNRARGNAGAIPASYLAAINGVDGAAKHLGKHLPYVPALSKPTLPRGMLALMWGDPSKGYAPHPNAAPSEANPEGHWFNWIRIRKATAGEAEERESRFSGWPSPRPGDRGSYSSTQGNDPTADSGKSTIYLAELPRDVQAGDVVRIHAHCLTHGEFVDFLTA